MRHLVKIHVLVLLAAVIFGTLANGNVPVHALEPARDAGCHEHQQPSPKTPVSYVCCQLGHGSMLVRVAETGPQDFAHSALQLLPIESERNFDFPHIVNPFSASTGEPPGPIPLRI